MLAPDADVNKNTGIGAYISFPFCRQKCTYCNFSSGVFPAYLKDQYRAALEAEIAAELWAEPPETVYLGGGTPSLLDPEELGSILGRLPGAPWKEATIEAAPGTVTRERAAAWRSLGINRVSLGVQSFVPQEIRATGRNHTATQVLLEIDALCGEGLNNINVDLIAGLPYQTDQSWRESLDWIEELAPPHVSVYMLEADEASRLGREILHGGTRYGAGAVPGDDQIAALYLEAVARFAALGIYRYEISNFARPGHESLHNLKYWRREPYRGFGAGAHSFDGLRRWSNVESAWEYVKRWSAGASPVDHIERLSDTQSMEEHFFVGLRQTTGIVPAEREWVRFAEPIRRLIDSGLLERDEERLRLTGRGVLLSNLVFEEFVNS